MCLLWLAAIYCEFNIVFFWMRSTFRLIDGNKIGVFVCVCEKKVWRLFTNFSRRLLCLLCADRGYNNADFSMDGHKLLNRRQIFIEKADIFFSSMGYLFFLDKCWMNKWGRQLAFGRSTWPRKTVCSIARHPKHTTLCNSRIWNRTQWAPINLCSFTLRAHTTISQITSIPIWLRNGWKKKMKTIFGHEKYITRSAKNFS